jgi:multiple sugar transport system substrate-binding protein
MTDIPRRAVVRGGVAAAGLGLLPGRAPAAEPAWTGAAPEPGASLRVLRWKQFIQAEYDAFMENTRAYSKATGVKVRVDAESWDDIRPKSAVAANVGAGPDIIMGTLDDPFKFADKLIDLTVVADYLGAKYGGWYKIAEKYGRNRRAYLPCFRPPRAIGATRMWFRR